VVSHEKLAWFVDEDHCVTIFVLEVVMQFASALDAVVEAGIPGAAKRFGIVDPRFRTVV
jgi:hypothetical protein